MKRARGEVGKWGWGVWGATLARARNLSGIEKQVDEMYFKYLDNLIDKPSTVKQMHNLQRINCETS